ncbi:MAG: tetratricopeptide repeat protein [Gemmatimonadaceae bacterium]
MSLRARLTRPWPDPARALLLFACITVAYLPALAGGTVWDDDRHITSGALQSLDGLRRIWFELGATQQYYPVLHSAFWLEHRLWADSPLGYHLLNVGLHGIAAVLVVVLCQRLAIRGAWLAGFLFALHPVAVESVAWISEQKNTLSLVFYLLATLGWLHWDQRRRARDYLAASAFFALALATKTVTATLPGALLVIVWWHRGRIDWRRDVVPLIPWVVVAAVSGLTTAWVERRLIGAEGAEFDLNAIQRVLLAGRDVAHYVFTLVWPARLAFMYPHWRIDAGNAWQYAYPAAALAGVFALWRIRIRSRAPLAAYLLLLGGLFPVLGFVNVYPFRYSYVADHFQYLASIGPIILAAAALTARSDRWSSDAARHVAVAALMAGLGALTWQQSANYRDAETLWRATISVNPGSWMAHHNLGRILSSRADGLPAAIVQYEETLRLKPDHARAHYALGVALLRVGRNAESVPHFEAALRLEPGNNLLVANASYLLGVEYMRTPARAAEAAALFAEAVRRKPGIAETHDALGEALLAAGRPDAARAEFETALRLAPGDERALANLARMPAAAP